MNTEGRHAARHRGIAHPCAVVVMGVSGCGKSTLGAALAAALGCAFIEGDSLHPRSNIAKMSAGQPLDDDDRAPWLDVVGRACGAAARETGLAVAGCSALKRAYRDRLRAAAGVPLRFVCLVGTRALLLERMQARSGHFMPPALLDSQLATLEVPGTDEDALVLDLQLAPAASLAQSRRWVLGSGVSIPGSNAPLPPAGKGRRT